MSQQTRQIRNESDLYEFLDNYAFDRRIDLDRHRLVKDKGLLTSYLLETASHNGKPDISAALYSTHAGVSQLDDNLFYVTSGRREVGYAQSLGSRYFVLYSIIKTELADRNITRMIKQSTNLDSLWLAGDVFQLLLQQIVAPSSPNRAVPMKFERQPRFLFSRRPEEAEQEGDDTADGVDMLLSPDSAEADDDSNGDESIHSDEHWGGTLIQQARQWVDTLPKYQNIDPSWRAIKMLRVPGVEQGGNDLWYWGKLTHRTSSFMTGRVLLNEIAEIYERLTQAIEDVVWLEAEPTTLGNDQFYRFRGSPVVFKFGQPLKPRIFHNFIEGVFEHRDEQFRLWGNPIEIDENVFHVYGLDLHVWQPLYMELSLDQFLFLLPKGTCGNTVHRLLTNIQRYLDPTVRMTIADIDYTTMAANAIRGREIMSGKQ